jgi:hypothetical protein
MEETQQGTEVFCTLGEGEEASLMLDAFYDTSGELVSWYSEGHVGETWIWSEGASGSLDMDAWNASFDYYLIDTEEGPEPVGSLSVAGTLLDFTDPMEIDDRFKDGNALVKVRGLVEFLSATGEVTGTSGLLDELAGEPLSCESARVDLTYWSTSPATRIWRGAGAGAYCMGEDWEFMLDVFGMEAYATFIDGIVRDEETGEWISSGAVYQGMLDVDGSHLTGMLEVVEPEPIGDLVVVDLMIGELLDSGTNKYSTPRWATHMSFESYALSGTLTLPDEEVVALDCTYDTYTFWERFSEKAGQKPGGKPPVNDLPENALALLDGASSKVNTRGAAEAPEAACSVSFEEGTWEVPIGRTVWYEVVGSGADVFLTTEGTSFDTVLGVYDTNLEPLACVDDTEETGLQASLLLPTEPGETYLVQVGGFAGEFGQLVTSRP